jgi:hypothetical protein
MSINGRRQSGRHGVLHALSARLQALRRTRLASAPRRHGPPQGGSSVGCCCRTRAGCPDRSAARGRCRPPRAPRGAHAAQTTTGRARASRPGPGRGLGRRDHRCAPPPAPGDDRRPGAEQYEQPEEMRDVVSDEVPPPGVGDLKPDRVRVVPVVGRGQRVDRAEAVTGGDSVERGCSSVPTPAAGRARPSRWRRGYGDPAGHVSALGALRVLRRCGAGAGDQEETLREEARIVLGERSKLGLGLDSRPGDQRQSVGGRQQLVALRIEALGHLAGRGRAVASPARWRGPRRTSRVRLQGSAPLQAAPDARSPRRR